MDKISQFYKHADFRNGFKARRNSHLQAVRKKKLMTKSELLFTQHCLEHVGL